MSILPAKKIEGITWEEIVLEAMQAISAGRAEKNVTSEEMYQWIEKTEYITEYGRAPDAGWNISTPSYRASLMLRWQRMVASGQLIRIRNGVYRAAEIEEISATTRWEDIKILDASIQQPERRITQVRRIQRSQRLRDALINYYDSHCQICSDDSPYLFSSNASGVLYSEVHHISGLAEAYLSVQSGILFGFRVNGLGNLVVLCPHHHALMHHHYPAFQFDRESLSWRNSAGTFLTFNRITTEHEYMIRSATDYQGEHH